MEQIEKIKQLYAECVGCESWKDLMDYCYSFDIKDIEYHYEQVLKIAKSFEKIK